MATLGAQKLTVQVGKPNLCKNIVRAVVSDPNTPALEKVPLVDRVSGHRHTNAQPCLALMIQVTWRFYLGLMAFLAGDEKKVRA